MKALTICQPYAHLIVRGEKRVENRDWPTNYRGRLLVHAGKSRAWLEDGDENLFRNLGDPLTFGAIVGAVTLVDVLHIDRIQTGDYDRQYPWLRAHEHTNGTWCWVLAGVTRFMPVPWKGSLGLFDVPHETLALRAIGGTVPA
jgi:hypothetical protein